MKMDAFEYFQFATVQISEGNRLGAAISLEKAIAQIDKDGIDAHMRDDFASLRRSLLAEHQTEAA